MTASFSKLSPGIPAADTRPEILLLLCCARTRIDSERAEQIRTLLRGDIDWMYLIRTAFQHSVMPLLYWNLHATCAKDVPDPILDQLRRRFHANSVRNLFLIRELLTLLALLDQHGILAIPYKGPVLAASVYGNFALRQFGDLDILVREQDAVCAKDLLLSRGYRLQYQPPAAYEAIFRHFRQTYDLVRGDGQVFVELHWNVISWPVFFSPDSAFVWERLELVSLAGMPVHTLAPEEVLPVLCVHGAKHHWERLGWICDVAELLRIYPGINWERVMAQASCLHGARALYLGLSLARSLLGAAVPEDILRQMQVDPVVPSLAARIHVWMFSGADSLLRTVEQHASYLRLEKGVEDKVRCGVYLVYRLIARLLYYVITPRIWRA